MTKNVLEIDIHNMISSSGKVLQYHRKKLCIKCSCVTDHTCFHMRYRRSETNDDAYAKAETWNCHTDSRACGKH